MDVIGDGTCENTNNENHFEISSETINYLDYIYNLLYNFFNRIRDKNLLLFEMRGVDEK